MALRLLLMFTLPVSLIWLRAFSPAVGTLAKRFMLRSLDKAKRSIQTCIQMHVGVDRICIQPNTYPNQTPPKMYF